MKGSPVASDLDRARQRGVVEAFLAASRGGDLDGLVAVLDPDVVLRVDRTILPAGLAAEVRGAEAVAARAAAFSRRLAFTQPALVDGAVGLVVAPNGKLLSVGTFTVANGTITAIDFIADPDRIGALDIAVLDA